MKKVYIMILFLVLSFLGLAKINASSTLELIPSETYVNDGYNPTVNFYENENNLYFNFKIPSYMSSNQTDFIGYIQNYTTEVLRFSNYPKINHKITANHTYSTFVVDNLTDSTTDYFALNDVNNLTFKSNGSSITVSLVGSNQSIMLLKNKSYRIYYQKSTHINSFQELPLTENEQYPTTIDKTDDGGYMINIKSLNNSYTMKITEMPEWLFKSKKVYYLTDLDNNKLLVGFYDGNTTIYEQNTFSDHALKDSFIVWNLETFAYQRSETDIVHAKVYDGAAGKFTVATQLYADVVIPHVIDDLHSISVSYSYKFNFLLGPDSKDWTYVHEQFLVKGKKSNQHVAWWADPLRWTTLITKNVPFGNMQVDQIKDITADADLNYKYNYVKYMKDNGSGTYSIDEIFTPVSKVYRLFLGQFDQYFATGIYTKEFAVIQYRYEYQGVIYSNPFPKTNAADAQPIKSPANSALQWLIDLLNAIWAGFIKYSYIAIPIIGVFTSSIALNFIQKIIGRKRIKYRAAIVLGWSGLLLVLWIVLINVV